MSFSTILLVASRWATTWSPFLFIPPCLRAIKYFLHAIFHSSRPLLSGFFAIPAPVVPGIGFQSSRGCIFLGARFHSFNFHAGLTSAFVLRSNTLQVLIFCVYYVYRSPYHRFEITFKRRIRSRVVVKAHSFLLRLSTPPKFSSNVLEITLILSHSEVCSHPSLYAYSQGASFRRESNTHRLGELE